MQRAALGVLRVLRQAFKVSLTALLLQTVPVAFSGERGAPAGDFDFYVLSLSWSPSYCAVEGADANRQQCAGPRAYAFVAHGLWPQYEHGYPEFCRSPDPDRVPDRLVQNLLDIMPSAGLIGHQWRKHGSCSGLGQADYFALLRKAREQIAVPPELSRLEAPWMISPQELEERFIASNPKLAHDGIAITCGKRYLREVRVCLTRDLQFRACPQVDRHSCRLDQALMPPVRGG